MVVTYEIRLNVIVRQSILSCSLLLGAPKYNVDEHYQAKGSLIQCTANLTSPDQAPGPVMNDSAHTLHPVHNSSSWKSTSYSASATTFRSETTYTLAYNNKTFPTTTPYKGKILKVL